MEEKIAIVTGSSRGIGRETGLLLAQNGYKVCVNYNSNAGAANEVVKIIEDNGGTAIAFRANIAKEDEVIKLFEEVDKKLGKVTVLINNAGIVKPLSSIEGLDSKRIEEVFATNVIGTILCCREAVKRMAYKHGGDGGSIVNVSSVSSLKGGAHSYIDYAASKGAVDTMTIGLALEVAKEGIRVNAVRPGFIRTDIHDSTGDENRAQKVVANIPIGRIGEPIEIAEAICWLVSEKASYATGTFMNVAGGPY